MMALPRPWPRERFDELDHLLNGEWTLRRRGAPVVGDSLGAQSEWLHPVISEEPLDWPLSLERRS